MVKLSISYVPERNDMLRNLTLLVLALAVCALSMSVCFVHAELTPPTATHVAAQPAHRVASQHLPNLVQIHPRVYSGGVPAGDAGFTELQSLGVKTIISVDGAKPDVAAAKQHGLRYVHLPHGYDGIPRQRAQELAKAVRTLGGPIYIHCHHGKHRSPAAAAVACIAAGMIAPTDGAALLELAGTSRNYRGLYDSVRSTVPLDAALLDGLDVEFRDTVEVPPLAEAMVAIEHTLDHLQQIANAHWHAPTQHPDLDPAHEALLLVEHFRELARTPDVKRQAAAFQQQLHEAEQSAHALEQSLLTWQANSDAATSAAPSSLDRQFAYITASCTTCHQQFRDNPLAEAEKR